MEVVDEDINGLRHLALRAARAGGETALRHAMSGALDIHRKPDRSIVTTADVAAEAAIAQVIRSQRPQDGWLGEEGGALVGSTPLTWIVDPIDGTDSFVRGSPHWAVLVACEHAELGVIAAAAVIPAVGTCYDAGLGLGARRDGNPIRASGCARLSEARYRFGWSGWFPQHGAEPAHRALLQSTKDAGEGVGSACAHLLVATGEADLIFDPVMGPWDIAATALIVSEAGGCWSDLRGERTLRGGSAVFSGGPVHDQAITVIRGAQAC
jgi:histidinol-phosphatase